MDGTVLLGIVCTILGGVALAVQSGINATLANSTSRPFASVVSFCTGTIVCLAYLLIDTTALKHQLPSVAGITSAPWWSWIGGLLGAYYVVVVIIFAEKLGAGTLVGIFVCAQLITSVILDLTGIVGFNRRIFSWQRVLGAALMIMGVVLVTQFPGEAVASVRLCEQQEKDAAAASNSSDSGSSSGRHLAMEMGVLGSTVGAPAAAAGVDATAHAVLSAAAAAVRPRAALHNQADMVMQLQDKV